MTKYDPQYMQKLTLAFYSAAMFLKDKVENHGWAWTSNFLREYARSAAGLKFSNTVSPQILRRLWDDYPELRPYLER